MFEYPRLYHMRWGPPQRSATSGIEKTFDSEQESLDAIEILLDNLNARQY